MHKALTEPYGDRSAIIASLKGAVIVSCQAGPDSPLNHPATIAALAQSSEIGGAAAFRVDGPANVAAVRAVRQVGSAEFGVSTPTFLTA